MSEVTTQCPFNTSPLSPQTPTPARKSFGGMTTAANPGDRCVSLLQRPTSERPVSPLGSLENIAFGDVDTVQEFSDILVLDSASLLDISGYINLREKDQIRKRQYTRACGNVPD